MDIVRLFGLLSRADRMVPDVIPPLITHHTCNFGHLLLYRRLTVEVVAR